MSQLKLVGRVSGVDWANAPKSAEYISVYHPVAKGTFYKFIGKDICYLWNEKWIVSRSKFDELGLVSRRDDLF